MSYQIKHADNNGVSYFLPQPTRAAACNERTTLIQAYGYNKAKGWTRRTFDNMVIFDHAIYSTAIFTIEKLNT
jgi:hypothetical protein